jgi:simple sugar transport system ATP-binding protein
VTGSSPILEARQLSKRYGGVAALNSIDLEIRKGELLAVVGDNGAGKSTLLKVLCGATRPDDGEIFHRGERVVFKSPLDARRRGIETIYQDLALVPLLDVSANLYLGRELVYRVPIPGLSILKRRAMIRGAVKRLRELEINIPVVSRVPTANLSGGQRQAVAIARAAAWASDVLFMDEPTTALGVRQAEVVITLARRLANSGIAVVLITHSLPQVMELADRIVVLRHGRKVADFPRSEATPERLVALIVGFDPGISKDESARLRSPAARG